MISLFVRFVIIVVIVVTVTDAIVFYHIVEGKAQITVPFIIMVNHHQ